MAGYYQRKANAELAWEIKKTIPEAHHDLKRIQSEAEAKMFCFAWGIPWEILTSYGLETLSKSWEDISLFLKTLKNKRFWEANVQERLQKTIEGRHFSPFIENANGYFEQKKHYRYNLNDVIQVTLDPGLKSKGKTILDIYKLYLDLELEKPTYTTIESLSTLSQNNTVHKLSFEAENSTKEQDQIIQKRILYVFDQCLKAKSMMVNSKRMRADKAERKALLLKTLHGTHRFQGSIPAPAWIYDKLKSSGQLKKYINFSTGQLSKFSCNRLISRDKKTIEDMQAEFVKIRNNKRENFAIY